MSVAEADSGDSQALKMDTVFSALQSTVATSSPELRSVSLAIWNHPETAYEEHFAHKLLTDFLEENNFTVTRSFHLPTAFQAEYRSANFDPAKHPTVAFLSEYDSTLAR